MSSLQRYFNAVQGDWRKHVPIYSTSSTQTEILELVPSADGDTDAQLTTPCPHLSLQTFSLPSPESAEWEDWERKNKWVKERNKLGKRRERKRENARARCSMVTRPLAAREHILDSTFSWRGLGEETSVCWRAKGEQPCTWIGRTRREKVRYFGGFRSFVFSQNARPWTADDVAAPGTARVRVSTVSFRMHFASICPQLQTVSCRTCKQVQLAFSIYIRSRLDTFTAPVVVLYREGKYIYLGAFEGVVIHARARSSSLIT